MDVFKDSPTTTCFSWVDEAWKRSFPCLSKAAIESRRSLAVAKHTSTKAGYDQWTDQVDWPSLGTGDALLEPFWPTGWEGCFFGPIGPLAQTIEWGIDIIVKVNFVAVNQYLWYPLVVFDIVYWFMTLSFCSLVLILGLQHSLCLSLSLYVCCWPALMVFVCKSVTMNYKAELCFSPDSWKL